MLRRLLHVLALDPNLVTHGAQISSRTHDEPEQVGGREVLGLRWVHRQVSVCVCGRPRLLHVDMLLYLPKSTGVRSSATVHEEADPTSGTHRLPKRAHAADYGGVETVEPLMVLRVECRGDQAPRTSTSASPRRVARSRKERSVRRGSQGIPDWLMSKEHDKGV